MAAPPSPRRSRTISRRPRLSSTAPRCTPSSSETSRSSPPWTGWPPSTAHIPNQGEHLVRYYGWYSNVSRGKRKKAQEQGQPPGPEGIVEVPPPPCSRALKQRWAQCIKKVYKADPLLCPRCKAPMRIIPPLLTRPQDTCIPWGLSLWEEHPPNGLTKGVCLVFCIGVTPRECGLTRKQTRDDDHQVMPCSLREGLDRHLACQPSPDSVPMVPHRFPPDTGGHQPMEIAPP